MKTIRASPLTVPSPRPSPPLVGLLNQSAKDAPNGLVTTYANQKAKIGLSPKRHQPTAGIEITAANSTTDGKKPRFKESAVRSPAAVPSAKVASTAVQ